jgi:hypothetical protein
MRYSAFSTGITEAKIPPVGLVLGADDQFTWYNSTVGLYATTAHDDPGRTFCDFVDAQLLQALGQPLKS